MPFTTTKRRIHVSAFSLFFAGIMFVIYPALRPFSDETSLEGAIAFASTEWLVAHMLAMVAFTLLPLGLHGVHNSLQGTTLTYWALFLCVIGVGLILPFYGGETFGLYAIGQEAIRLQSGDLVNLAVTVRSGAGLIMFVTGLLLLAISSILLATAIWKSEQFMKWCGIPFAIGMSTYIPQFFFDQPLRVTHGLLVAIGCTWIAVCLWRTNSSTMNQNAQTIHS
ncbi:hypothetical protein [Bacillus alkalicellulosilyticus]|uniref:hypothetical protein n=1 Tax=Alkalihalobacterium alkalicellulosilyticum TaxID=1912214 RepID=UPI00099671A3|nr:hypothetical protein [Bacillus alkalicellulosilyticus]